MNNNIFINSLYFNRAKNDDLNNYMIGGYHTTYIGEIFEERYVIIRKLSNNRLGTFWICMDMKFNIYVCIKIYKSSPFYTNLAYDEIEILQKIDTYRKSNKWKHFLIKNNLDNLNYQINYYNFFIINGPLGDHVCLVLELLSIKLSDLINNINLNENQKNNLINDLLKSLFLIEQYDIIHTNINLKNYMVSLPLSKINELVKNDNIIIENEIAIRIKHLKEILKLENNLLNENLTKKQKKQIKKKNKKKEKNKININNNKNKTNIFNKSKSDNISKSEFENKSVNSFNNFYNKKIFQTRSYPNLKQRKYDNFSNYKQITNKINIKIIKEIDLNNIKIRMIGLSNSRIKKTSSYELITNINYRSPEIFLKLGYNTKVDIWSFGCLVYRILYNKDIFDFYYDNIFHHMYKYLGKMPNYLINSSSVKKKYFNDDFSLKSKSIINKKDFYKELKNKYSEKNSKYFHNLLRKIFIYDPSKRLNSLELYNREFNEFSSDDSENEDKILLSFNKNVNNYNFCDMNLIDIKKYFYYKFFKILKEIKLIN